MTFKKEVDVWVHQGKMIGGVSRCRSLRPIFYFDLNKGKLFLEHFSYTITCRIIKSYLWVHQGKIVGPVSKVGHCDLQKEVDVYVTFDLK